MKPGVPLKTALLVWALRLLGFKSWAVRTGSMAPNWSSGALAFTRRVRPARLKKGMPVVFCMPDGVPVLHRILWVDRKNRTLVTKGDANAWPDPVPVPFVWVQGVCRLCLPGQGRPFLD